MRHAPHLLPTFGLPAALLLLSLCRPAAAQTWTRLTHDAPANVELLLLLSDGTVMAANNYDLDSTDAFNNWYRLTPDATGSYADGTWTMLASMHDTRLYYSSQVLRDGRVFVAGGEYGTGGSRAEVYDPQTNVWTQLPIPTTVLDPSQPSPVTGGSQRFSDSNSEILPDGRVIITPVSPRVARQTVIYDPANNAWSNGPTLFRGSYQDEASWVKLPDGSILTIDPFGTHSERFIPSMNAWVNDGTVPVAMYDPYGYELGAGTLLPNGNAFFLGSTGHTALYQPSGTAAPGVWTAGPDIPDSQGTPDAPAAMLPNGRLLCAVSPVPTSANHFPAPTRFFEYDWQTNAFSPVPAPNGDNDPIPCYSGAMLVLPDGGVLFSHFGQDLYIYRSAGDPLASGKPVVESVSQNPDGSYHLTGTGLNGLSEGAWFGDDLQMNSNYPIVRLRDGGPSVYYARTFNWSSTGVRTGAQVVSTEFTLPADLPPSAYSLEVVANGIASDPFCLAAPQIVTPPSPGSACGGNPARFDVQATGVGPLTYQWEIAASEAGPWQSLGNDPAPLPCGGFAYASPFDAAAASIGVQGCPGPFFVRVVVTNDCGSTTSDPVPLRLNSADFNHDGDIGTDADIEAYFACLAGDCCPTCGSADFNGDGDIGTDADLESFFRVLAGGAC